MQRGAEPDPGPVRGAIRDQRRARSAILGIYLYNNVGSARHGCGGPKRHFVLLSPTPEVLRVIKIAGFDRYQSTQTGRSRGLFG
jgi:hypothetical protein